MAALAEGSGRSPLEVAYDHMLTRGAKGMIWRALGAVSRLFPLLSCCCCCCCSCSCSCLCSYRCSLPCDHSDTMLPATRRRRGRRHRLVRVRQEAVGARPLRRIAHRLRRAPGHLPGRHGPDVDDLVLGPRPQAGQRGVAAGVLRAEAGPRPGLHVRECTTFTIPIARFSSLVLTRESASTTARGCTTAARSRSASGRTST